MRTAMSLAQAKDEVTALLRSMLHVGDATSVTIYLWWDGDTSKAPPCVGIRVAEISVSQGNGGCSWMAGQPDNLGVIAAVERCLIERMACTCDAGTWDDEVRDADWRLSELLQSQVG